MPDLLNSLILAVIIIVVVVPEGLPMMIAIVLAQNMKKLLKSKVLVRQLMGIETAGSLNMLKVLIFLGVSFILLRVLAKLLKINDISIC